MARHESLVDTSTKLQRIADQSRRRPDITWTTLAHHIDVDFLRDAFKRVPKNKAPGVDGVTANQYAENLDANLERLLTAFKTGCYRAPPVKRVHIPKGAGKTRPIGIPTIEDKLLQRAVTMILESIYEQDFLDCSYGFRPGRSQHQALEALWKGMMAMGGGTIVELDIMSFFDTIDHAVLRSFLDKRIRDGVLRRAIGKWLKAGVLEDEMLRRPSEGTPQGGVISPLLANLYLHEVLDLWFEQVVKPRMHGQAFMVRFADDAVLVFELANDADRVLAVLAKRFAKFGLRLHPEKTRRLRFLRPGPSGRMRDGDRPDTFNFLGFTHYWGRSRKGRPVVKRKTAKDRFSRSLRKISDWCRRHRHMPVRDQAASLRLKLRGHYGYYGLSGNMSALSRYLHEVKRIWKKWLSRRSWKTRLTWDAYNELLKKYPLPSTRLANRA